MLYITFQIAMLYILRFKAISQVQISIVFVLIAIFILLTQEGSWDFLGYKQIFECAIEAYCNLSIEASFSILSRFVYFLLGDVLTVDASTKLLLALYSCTSLFIKLAVMKRETRWFGVSLFSYLCYGFYLQEMTQVRAALSISFCWLAYSNFSNKNHFKTAVYLAFAAIFHLSGLLGIVAIAVSRAPVRVMIALICSSIVVGLLFDINQASILAMIPIERVSVYIAAQGSQVLTATKFNVFILFNLLLFLLLFKKSNVLSKFEKLALNSTAIGLSAYFLTSTLPIIPVRILEFLTSTYPFLIAAAVAMTKNSISKVCIAAIPIVLWFNLAIRNNTRLDLIMSWQNISVEYMTPAQYDAYLESLK